METLTLTTEEIKAKQAAHKCEACNKRIKYDYWWNNQMLGIECWKKIALPEIEKQRQAAYQERKNLQWEQDYALAETLRVKDYSKIRSEFKLKFLNGLVEQWDEQGFISWKQKEMVYGTGAWNGSFYDYGMLNDTDKINEATILYLIGSEQNKQTAVNVASAMSEKYQAQFNEATNQGDTE